MTEKGIKLAGVWENKNKKGEKYLAGSLNGCPFCIFKNNFKKPDSKEPDFNLFVYPYKPKEEKSDLF